MKFINLLKKELTELINKQMLIGIAVMALLFMVLGQVMESSIEEISKSEYKMNILNCDETDFTKSVLDEMKAMGAEINMIDYNSVDFANTDSDTEIKNYSDLMSKNNIENLVVIPHNFTQELLENKNLSTLETISVMKSTSSLSSISADTSGAVSLLETVIRNQLMKSGGFSEEEIALIQSPFTIKDVTVVSDKHANISMGTIINNVSMQNMIIPIIVFILVMYTSQMIIGAISTEKIDKTLETLLSAPVSRSSVLGAKMLAAAIVALINAAVYMVGFYVFIGGTVTSAVDSSNTGAVISEAVSYSKAMDMLGLSLGIADYILIGIQMFLTIMISLSVSIILGAMANDAKSAQNLIMPVMMCAMIPYMISMVSDINQLSPVLKVLVYAIPFTHTFTAMSNLMFGNDSIFIFGIIYQTVFFSVCMIFAIRIFNSDKIFTSSLNLGQKSRLKKQKRGN